MIPLISQLFGAALAVSISATEILMAVLFVACAIRGFPARHLPSKDRSIGLALLVFYAWGIATALGHRSVAPLRALHVQHALAFYFLVARGMSFDENVRWLRWFAAASVVVGVLGGIQLMSGLDLNALRAHPDFPHPTWLPSYLFRHLASWNGRAVGTRSHPLTYAEGLMPALFILVHVLSKPALSTRRRWMFALGILTVTAGLIASNSRGPWIAVICGMGIFIFVRRGSVRIRSLALAGLLTCLMVAGLFKGIRGRMLSAVSSHQGSLADQQSKGIRLALWRQSIESIERHPISGVGLRGAEFVVPDPNTGQPVPWTESHDIYLQMAVEEGLVGLGLMTLIFALVARAILRMPVDMRAVGLAILTSFLVAGLTESWLNDGEIAMIFFSFVGLCVSFNDDTHSDVGPDGPFSNAHSAH